MNKLESEQKYEEIKNLHQASARAKEKKIKRDLTRLMSSATPRFLREKLVMSCVVFGSVYLLEELVFRKRVPAIVKFVGAVSATAFAPKMYRTLYANFSPETDVVTTPAASHPGTDPLVAASEVSTAPPPRTFPRDE